jgi:hypothetical protein
MSNGTMVVPAGGAPTRTLRLRVAAVIAAFALTFAMLVLVQDRADASPASGSVAAAVVVSGPGAAQLEIGAITCPILLAVRAAFANSPFAGFVVPILNQLIVAFGCAPS